MKDKQLVKIVNNLSDELSSAIQANNYEQVNIVYDKLSGYLSDDYNLYKGWFEYLLFNYEYYINTNIGVESILLNAIAKCKKAEEICEKEYLSDLYFYEYKLIDTLTEYNDSYFQQFSGEYQLNLLNKTIELNPSNTSAFEKRGNIYMALGDTEKARKDFENMENLSVNMKVDDFNLLTQAFNNEMIGESEKAILKYEKILKNTKLQTIQKICYENLINIYKKENNQEKIDFYEDLLDNL